MTKKIIIICIIIAIVGIVGIIALNNKSNIILLNKTIYNYPYKEVIKIEKNGKVYKSQTVDELTKDGALKDHFTYTKNVSDDDLKEIKSIINQMKIEDKKSDHFSENYGIAVNFGEDKFYGCEYFLQEEVDKLNSIIKKYEWNVKILYKVGEID